MNEKQNNKFALGNLYPEYFKSLKQPTPRQEIVQPAKILKSKEDQKIQSKLKTIIYNLQRQIEEKSILSKHKYKFGDSSDTDRQSIPSRSISLKLLANRGYSYRYKTQLQPSAPTDTTQRKFAQKRFRKHSQAKEQNRLSEQLILPKLKINSKNGDNIFKKQLSKKKKLKRLEQLDEKQHQLGKIVLQKVEKHFQIEKQGKRHYFQRVKEQQGIDQSFLAYLRNKVKKADIALDR